MKFILPKTVQKVLLFSLALVGWSLVAWAQNNSKMSDDLKAKVAQGGTGKIAVIMTTPATPTTSLSNDIPTNGGALKRVLNKVNAVSCELPPAVVAKFAARTDVKYVALDRVAKSTGHLETTTGAALARAYGTTGTGTIDGHGIGIAILDSGINAPHYSFLKDPANSNSGSRVVYSIDFTGTGTTDDLYGHGSHVAGMAAAGSRVSSGAYTGVASAANLINVRVLDANGSGSASNVIAGIDWCIANKATYNIKVMNLSLGTTAVDSYLYDPLCQAVRRAFDAGIVVVVAAGNAGKDSTGQKVYGGVHSPGIEPSAITVGAANTYGTDARNDDTVTTYSSRGPTRGYYTDTAGVRHYDNLVKPDLIAPGNWLIEPQAPNNNLVLANPELDANVSNNTAREQMYLSGTSMAAPAVAGAAAMLLQRNPSLTPNLVKAILEYSAQPLANFNNLEQGAGLMNVEGAVRLAGLIRTDLTGRVKGDALLCTGCSAPTLSSTLGGTSFNWGGALIQKWNFVTGLNLITKYQGIYGTGVVLSDGTLLSNGIIIGDGVVMSDGVVLSDGVVMSDGVIWSNTNPVTVQGIILGDGVVMSDGQILGDGVVMSDNVFMTSGSNALLANSVLKNGDKTVKMKVTLDSGK